LSVARRSIRVRVTAIAVAVTAVVLSLGALAVAVVEHGVLDDDLEHSLDNRADALAGGLKAGDRSFAVGDDEDRLVQVVTAAGDVIAASPRLRGQPALGPALVAGAEQRGTITGGAIGTERFRLLSRGVATGSGTVTVYVAENTDDIGDAVRALSVSLALTVAAAVIVLGLLVWWLVGRTLRPVEEIRAEVAEIGAGGLDRRVPVPPSGDEIARLAGTMNGMLDRLQDAAARQDRFVSDASHELRSPLARLRAIIEVQLASEDRSGDRAALDEALAETEALQRLLDDLLDLARLDATPRLRRTDRVELDDLALEQAGRVRRTGLTVDTSGVGAAQVVGDPRQLARAVQNLLDNASRHARSTVSIAVSETADAATVEVSDDGGGIPAGSEAAAFAPFTRLDEARDPNTGHAGLGLAIVHEIVTAHDGTVHVERGPGGGAVFVVRLPRGEADSS
jgi:signal transduction histidine kinase